MGVYWDVVEKYILIADTGNNRIRKITPDGTITTIAGNGTKGFSGDGSLATNASLNSPTNALLGFGGQVLISDTGNNRIRKIGLTGMIATMAGSGNTSDLNGPRGMSVESTNSLLVADTGNHRILRVFGTAATAIVAGTGVKGFPDDGPQATAATLNSPSAVLNLGSGSFLISDSGNNRIRKVTADGKITAIAGGGNRLVDGVPATSVRLSNPDGIVKYDSSGEIVFFDSGNFRIRKIEPDGTISTIGGNGSHGYSGDDGPAVSASLSYPGSVAAAPDGSMYIADTNNHRIRQVSPSGIITTVAGNGGGGFTGDGAGATATALFHPRGVAVAADGSILIADTDSHRIRKIARDGKISTVAGGGPGGEGEGGAALTAALSSPYGVATGAGGSILVADTNNHRIRRVSANGTITTVAGTGAAGPLAFPQGVAEGPDGTVWIADTGNHRIRRVSPTGNVSTAAGNGTPGFSGDGGPATAASLNNPADIAVAADGSIVFSDSNNNRIRAIALNGTITTVAGNGAEGFTGDGASVSLNHPLGIDFAADGSILIADSSNGRIRQVSSGKAAAAPTLTLSVAQLGLTATAADQTVNVGSSGAALAFSAQSSTAWLQISPAQGNTPATLTLHANTQGLAAGNYSGTVTVAAVGASNSPVQIAVTLTVPPGSAKTVTIASAPSGLTLNVDGALIVTPQDFNWTPNSTHTVDGGIPQSAGSTRYNFDRWSNGGAASQSITATANPATYTAFFAAQYPLTLAANPASGGTLTASPSSPDGYYGEGSLVRLVASAATGYTFANFSGDATGTASPATLTMSSPKRVTANFTGGPVVSNVTITSDPPGREVIVDGATVTTPRDFDWTAGSAHSVDAASPQASGATRYLFDRWSNGGSKSQSITAPAGGATFTAVFAAQHLLTLVTNPPSGGSLTASPSSADGYYSAGSQVRLTASAASGFAFTNFTGDATGTSSPQTITMSGPRSVTANFRQVTLVSKITIASDPPGRALIVDGASITAPRDFDWTANTAHTVDATTPQGTGFTRYAFNRWSQGGAKAQTITAPPAATTYTATFTPRHLLTLSVAPSNGGTLTAVPASADGFYDEGSQPVLTATPFPGFVFSAFSGDIGGPANPRTLALSAPADVTAVFTQAPTDRPRLISDAIVSGMRFEALNGGAAPKPQVASVTSSDGAPRGFTVNVNYPPGAPRWVDLITRSGATPGSISVGVDVTVLKDFGTYTAGLAISAAGADDATVRLTLEYKDPPQAAISLDVKELKLFSAGDVQQQSVILRNPSPLTISFDLDRATDNGQSWLTVNTVAASVLDGQPAVIKVSADPGGLSSDTYTGKLVIKPRGQPNIEVPVVFAVAAPANRRMLRTAEAALNWRVGRDYREFPPQTLELVASGGVVTWNVTVDVPWVTLNPPGGQIQPGAVGKTDISVDLARLQLGSNRAVISISSDSAGGLVTVPLEIQVMPSGFPVYRVTPTGMAFVAPKFDTRKVIFVASKPGNISTGSTQPAWLRASAKALGTGLVQGQIHEVSIDIIREALPPGDEQRGIVTIQDPSGAGPNINVLVYTPPGASATGSAATRSPGAECQPNRFLPLFTSLLPNFDQSGGAASAAEVIIIDDCGQLVTNAVTGAVLSNGDPQLDLKSLGDGRWKATFNPLAGNQVSISVLASDPDRGIKANRPEAVIANVQDPPTRPALAKDQPFETEAGVRLPAFSPSMRFRIRGVNLAGAEVSIGGRPLSIVSASDKQIVAVTPDDLPANVESQIVIRAGGSSSVPEAVIVAGSWPALASAPAAGSVLMTGLGVEGFEIQGARVTAVTKVEDGLWRVEFEGGIEAGTRVRRLPKR